MTNEQLLKVLDLPEEEQQVWVSKNVLTDPDERQMFYKGGISLAGLAFRMRDEVVDDSGQFNKAQFKVFLYLHEDKSWLQGRPFGDQQAYCNIFWREKAKPIHWIVAVLIAKNEKGG
jgi:hypothetical protein